MRDCSCQYTRHKLTLSVPTLGTSRVSAAVEGCVPSGSMEDSSRIVLENGDRAASVVKGNGPAGMREREAMEEADADQVVTPWVVAGKDGGGIDYEKLIVQFGCQRLDSALVERVERLTERPAHPFLRRGVFFAHREFNQILDAYEKGEKFYLYTGRGPSSDSLHLGHLVPFMFTKYLQDAFKVPLVIQLTDDEKCMWKDLSVEKSQQLARENAKDIIACGFDITRTFIFSDFDFVGGEFYRNMIRIAKCVTLNQVRNIFGFVGEHNIGKVSFPPVQGDSGKMLASDTTRAIYVTDTPNEISTKIKKFAFSGVTTKKHKNKGPDSRSCLG